MFIVGAYFYPLMPEQIASHWNAKGEVDGYMSKFWGLFFMPLLILFMNASMILVPKIDPKKSNIEKFKGFYGNFIIIFNLFMLYVFSLTIAWNMGYYFDMTVAIIPALAIFFYFVGQLVGKAKRNYLIGIKLPWTLDNDVVWDKTHKVGERVFKIMAIIILFGVFFKDQAFWFMFVPLLLGMIYLVVYSYVEFKKISKN
jgi:uncharacterized membrane protein